MSKYEKVKIDIKRGRLYKGLPLKNHKGSWEFVGENEVHYVCPELAWKINTLFKQSEILQAMSNIERPKEFQFDAKEDGRADYDWKAYAESLEKENEELELTNYHQGEALKIQDMELQKLKEELIKMVEYADHKKNCMRDFQTGWKCSCGLDELLKQRNKSG